MSGEQVLKFWQTEVILRSPGPVAGPRPIRLEPVTSPADPAHPIKVSRLTKITIMPRYRSFVKTGECEDSKQFFRAQGQFSDDGPPKDITDLVSWNSSNREVIWIQGHLGYARMLKNGQAVITAELSGIHDSLTAIVDVPKIDSLQIDPAGGYYVGGGKKKLTARAFWTNGHETEAEVTWKAEPPKIATINKDTGEVTMLGIGTAKITARERITGVEAHQDIHVIPPGKGARRVGVMIEVNNFTGESVYPEKAVARFQASGATDVVVNGEIWKGVFKADDIFLIPQGTLTFESIDPRYSGKQQTVSDVAPYRIAPGSEHMVFTADQIPVGGAGYTLVQKSCQTADSSSRAKIQNAKPRMQNANVECAFE